MVRTSEVEEPGHCVDHIEGLGDGELLQGVAVRGGDVSTGHTQDRPIQIIKSLT